MDSTGAENLQVRPRPISQDFREKRSTYVYIEYYRSVRAIVVESPASNFSFDPVDTTLQHSANPSDDFCLKICIGLRFVKT
jgi:hypothetical protein